jgi:hypothetical protein
MDPAMSPVRRRRGVRCSGGAGIDHDGVSGSGDGTLGFVGVYWLIDSSSLASDRCWRPIDGPTEHRHAGVRA